MPVQCPYCSSLEKRVNEFDLQITCSQCGRPIEITQGSDTTVGRIPDDFEEDTQDELQFQGSTDTITDSSESRSFDTSNLSGVDRARLARVRSAYRMTYFLSLLLLSLGLWTVLLNTGFLHQLGFGFSSIITGTVLGLLGYSMSRGSMFGLVLAIALYIGDTVLSLQFFASSEAYAFAFGVAGARLALLLPLIRAVTPLHKLRSSTNEIHMIPLLEGVQRAYAALCVLLLFGFIGLRTTGSGFGHYEDRFLIPNTRVTVRTPSGSPEQDVTNIPFTAGQLQQLNYRWMNGDGAKEVGVLYLPNNPLDQNLKEQILDQFIQSKASEIKDVLHRRTISRSNFDATNIKLRFVSPKTNETRIEELLVFHLNNRLVYAGYIDSETNYDDEHARRFLDTIQFH